MGESAALRPKVRIEELRDELRWLDTNLSALEADIGSRTGEQPEAKALDFAAAAARFAHRAALFCVHLGKGATYD